MVNNFKMNLKSSRTTNQKQYAPATQRNRQPILEVLKRTLPARGNILEIASGTGEHGTFFAPHFHPRQWIPSDANPSFLASIRAWRQDCPTDNLQLPLCLDAIEPRWPIEDTADDITGIVNINMIHIAPWQACLGLLAGARRMLPSGGILYLYGPYKVAGKHRAPSNLAFDQSLRQQDPLWGVRDLDEVVAAAERQGLSLEQTFSMPANNLSVIFKKN
jgi:hypothetical protein